MHFNLLLPSQILADWGRIGAALSPAVDVDETRQIEDVRRDLLNGDMALYDIDLHGAQGFAVIEFTDARVCWLLYVAGHISRSGFRRRVRLLALVFEYLARRNGCVEIRLQGRDWSRLLPGWERADGPNELRKVL